MIEVTAGTWRCDTCSRYYLIEGGAGAGAAGMFLPLRIHNCAGMLRPIKVIPAGSVVQMVVPLSGWNTVATALTHKWVQYTPAEPDDPAFK